MKSTRRKLEDEVVTCARAWATLLRDAIRDQDCSNVYYPPEVRYLLDAVDALDAHIEAITDAQGAFVPGSATSEAAAVLGRIAAGSVRRRIVDEVRSIGLHSAHVMGLTDDELERRLHRAHTTVSSARNWLVHAGWLTDSGYTRRTSSGRDATVWKLTPAAQAQVASPEWVERNRA
jgi:hypothetical protein